MKVLFFSPHAAIWIHAFPEALVAEALQQGGHEIVYVTCGMQLKSACVAMSAHGVPADAPAARKAEVCRKCESNKELLRERFGFAGGDLAAALTPAEVADVRAVVASATRDNFLSIEAAGVDAGRVALYEFLLDHKKSSLEFVDDAEWHRYLASLESTLYAIHGVRRLLEREAPDAVVVYNALYSINRAVCKMAQQRGVAHYFMHAGGNLAHRLQTLMLAKGDIFNLMRRAIEAWPARRDTGVDASTARAITDHFIELLRGRSAFAYSAPQTDAAIDLKARFGIGAGQKVVCATLSSYDERFAAETVGARPAPRDLLFPLQADWMEAMIDYARARPDRFLIIRVHPREFPNKREGVRSAHSLKLAALLTGLPANVAVNWPDDQLSLYDLAEVVDVFANAWSSVGKEMGLLGIPVVLYCSELPLYPADLNYVGESRQTYFAALEQALADGWRRDNIVKAYRWCAIEYGSMLIDIADAYDASEYPSTSFAARAWARLLRALDPLWRQRRDCARRPPRMRAQAQIAALFASGADSVLDARVPVPPVSGPAEPEEAVIRTEIARLVAAMYPRGDARSSKLGRRLADLVENADAE
jgi:hypothetical protein